MDYLSLFIFLSGFLIVCLFINFHIEKSRIHKSSQSYQPCRSESEVVSSKMMMTTPKIPVRSVLAENKASPQAFCLVEAQDLKRGPSECMNENFIHTQLRCTLDYTPGLSSRAK